MKRLITTALMVAIVAIAAQAQIELPAPSPTATLSQKIGLTDFTITYSRPGVKDRTVFGDLVPYGKLWRTGANMATKIEFNDDIQLHDKDIPAGTYALFSIPTKDEWTIILNKNYNQGGTSQYSEEDDVLRFTVNTKTLPMKVETFTISIDDVRNTSANLNIMWESTMVSIPVSVNVETKVMASIDRAFNTSARDYYQAAVYYHESKKDLTQAHEWISKSIELYEKDERNVFWIYRRKSLIEAEMKDYKAAIKTAEVSLMKAKEAKNDDYIRMNEASISEWKNL